jgi:DGQHR domain-containing protein
MIKIPLIKSSKILESNFYSGRIGVKDLIDNSEFPRYEPGSKSIENGYQRAPKDNRVSAIKDRVRNDPESMDSFITNITVNVRSEEAEKSNIIKVLHDGEDLDHYIFQYIPDLGPFFLVDGQTRVMGISLARAEASLRGESKIVEAIDNSVLSITLSFTEDIYKEAYFFYLINQYAKAIPAEGAMRMIYDGYARGEGQFENEIYSKSSKYTTEDMDAMKVAELLYKDEKSVIWSERIKDFNETGVGKISIRAVALKMCKRIMKKISDDLYKTDTEIDAAYHTFKIINAYWVAIECIFPEMFSSENERKYNITKSSQAEVMNGVLFRILERCTSDGYWEKNGAKWTDKDGNEIEYKFDYDPHNKVSNLRDPNFWLRLLENPLTSFEGEDTEGITINGGQNWKVGQSGSMGKYTSAQAKKDIENSLFKSIENYLGVQN